MSLAQKKVTKTTANHSTMLYLLPSSLRGVRQVYCVSLQSIKKSEHSSHFTNFLIHANQQSNQPYAQSCIMRSSLVNMKVHKDGHFSTSSCYLNRLWHEIGTPSMHSYEISVIKNVCQVLARKLQKTCNNCLKILSSFTFKMANFPRTKLLAFRIVTAELSPGKNLAFVLKDNSSVNLGKPLWDTLD